MRLLPALLLYISAVALPASSREAITPAEPRAEFEVVSVKPSEPRRGSIGVSVYPGGRVVFRNSKLELLIQYAFDIQPFQIAEGPAWLRDFNYRYEIEALPPSTSKSSKSNPSTRKAPLNDEQREMLQSLLIDRFQLRFHREPFQARFTF